VIVDAGWSSLRDILIESYDELARKLTRRLRSSELAREALQDTYLRLERGGQLGKVDHPAAYVLRIAMNLARDRLRAEKELATAEEIEAALEVADDRPDPAQAAEARSELAIVERALEKMSARRRAIFLAAWKGHLSSREIARKYDLSVRQIDVELKRARELCIMALKKASKNNAQTTSRNRLPDRGPFPQ
jgi:RNA polymerase sigma-70 factor, ECF subfamily